MRTPFEDVGDFHKKFGLPRLGPGRPPSFLDGETLRYRVGFMQEELAEFVEAADRGDMAGMLDALVDLTWVAMGTAHYMGVPFDDAWDEVLRANMEKTRGIPGADNGYKRGAAEVIRKPAGWRPPDIVGVLSRYEKFRQALAMVEQQGARYEPVERT